MEELGQPTRRVEDGPLVVTYAGAHGPVNALDTVLDTAAALGRTQPGRWEFRLIGDGVEKLRLESRAASEGIASIRFLDPVPKSEIYALLDEADIFVLPLTRGELFRHGVSPNKLFDYMATGRPIVYAVDSSNDPVTECGAGIRVPPEDPSAMADALKQLQALAADERFAMGMRGRRYAADNHDLHALAARLEKVLVSSVADKRRPSRIKPEEE